MRGDNKKVATNAPEIPGVDKKNESMGFMFFLLFNALTSENKGLEHSVNRLTKTNESLNANVRYLEKFTANPGSSLSLMHEPDLWGHYSRPGMPRKKYTLISQINGHQVGYSFSSFDDKQDLFMLRDACDQIIFERRKAESKS